MRLGFSLVLALLAPVAAGQPAERPSDRALLDALWTTGTPPAQLSAAGLDDLHARLSRALHATEDVPEAWGAFHIARGADLNLDGRPDAVLYLIQSQHGTADNAVYLQADDGTFALAGRASFVLDGLAACPVGAGAAVLLTVYQTGAPHSQEVAWRVGDGALTEVDPSRVSRAGCLPVAWEGE